MYWIRKERKDFFWTGFFAGTVMGGTLGVLFASEAGKRAYRKLEMTMLDLQSRFNGKAPSEEPADEPQAVQSQQAEENPGEHSG